MIINGERALAYVVSVDDVTPIEKADNIELAHVGGWTVIVRKGEFTPGSPGVFFEIDSKLPEEDERFAFLAGKHYRIKTMKLSKFGVYSQGLLMPLSMFPELGEAAIGTDVTKKLGVTYAVAEDNIRKANTSNPNYKSMAARHPRLFKTRPVRFLMMRKWGRKLLYFFFRERKPQSLAFPDFVSKTDEERIENQPWRVGDGKQYIATEKLYGTSCTYALKKRRWGKTEFFVCSRNVRQKDENQKCYHDHNIYWDLAFKFDIEDVLKELLKETDADWVCIQGEGVGSVQGNPLKLKEDDLYVFNLIDSVNGRWDSVKAAEKISAFGMKWVPILGCVTLPDDMETLKEEADGKSLVNPAVLREGIVYRSLDGKDSFKNVSRKYLLKGGRG